MNRTLKLVVVFCAVIVALLLICLNAIPTNKRHAPMRTISSTTSATRPTGDYTVEMSPMGKVTFKSVPQRIVTQDANYDDMLVAVRHNKGLVASGYDNNDFDGYYKQIASVETNFDGHRKYLSPTAGGGSGSMFDKESLYSLHPDVFHIDPVQLSHAHGWSKNDVDEIAANVAPFFANRYSRTNDYKGPEPYRYYDVWELSEKLGEVYQETDRVTRLKAVYDQMVAEIQAKLPPVNQRPKVGIVLRSSAGFLPYSMAKGFDTEQYRAVGAVDAFAGLQNVAYSAGGGNAGGTRLDLEGMLGVDPDVLITPFAVLPAMSKNHEQLLALRTDPLGSRLKAVKNDRLYPGGTPIQGPITLMFQVEMAAKQIYPELFGTYHNDQHYDKKERLFDRSRVANILNAPAGAATP